MSEKQIPTKAARILFRREDDIDTRSQDPQVEGPTVKPKIKSVMLTFRQELRECISKKLKPLFPGLFIDPSDSNPNINVYGYSFFVRPSEDEVEEAVYMINIEPRVEEDDPDLIKYQTPTTSEQEREVARENLNKTVILSVTQIEDDDFLPVPQKLLDGVFMRVLSCAYADEDNPQGGKKKKTRRSKHKRSKTRRTK